MLLMTIKKWLSQNIIFFLLLNKKLHIQVEQLYKLSEEGLNTLNYIKNI